MKKNNELIETARKNLLGKIKDAGTIQKVKEFLRLAGNFHNYSFGNMILIWSQMPMATRVAGFHSWKKLGRSIKTGSHGIKIMAPCPYEVKDDDGKTKEHVFFRAVSVFDISQTHGKDLPDLTDVRGNSKKSVLGSAVKYAQSMGAKVEFCRIGCDGMVNGSNQIFILDSMPVNRQLITLFHELAHMKLGHIKTDKHDRQREEIEAEVCAYVCSSAFGLDAMSEEYLLTYKADDEKILEAFECATKTANEIINGVGAM